MENEFTLELAKLDDRRSLVAWVIDDQVHTFVVCSFYDPTKPVGQQWSWGHYFTDVFDAVRYATYMDESKED